MARAESTITPFPAGSGREIDLTWPVQTIFAATGATPSGNIANRNNGLNLGSATLSGNNHSAGYTSSLDGITPMICATFGATTATVGDGTKWVFAGGGASMQFFLFTQVVGGNQPDISRFQHINAWRMMMISSFNVSGVATAAIDCGMEICTAGAATIEDCEMFRLKTPGIGFRVSAANTLQACWNAIPGSTPATQVVATDADGYNSQGLNAYEIRVLGAQGAKPAVCKWMLNGRILFQRAWDAGNMPVILPGPPAWVGFIPSAVNNGGSPFTFYVKNISIHAARNEANLL